MEILTIAIYAAVCIALFAVLRIPLNRWTVPSASIGGVVMVFALIQFLNFYHPHSSTSQQQLTDVSIAPAIDDPEAISPLTVTEPNVIAWFHRNSLLRLEAGSDAEVSFEHIPGRVFAGKVIKVLGATATEAEWAQWRDQQMPADRIPVLIEISDPAYGAYLARIPGGAHAEAAVYGRDLEQLALVRKTLLRMSAWMNYLTPLT